MAAIKVLGVDHLVIRVTDMEAMIAFYRDVLGCTVERRVEDFGLVQLRAGRSLVDLVDIAGKLGREGGAAPGSTFDAGGRNLDHFCLRLESFDIEALRTQLGAHGVEVGEVAKRYGADGFGPSIYITDPESNTVELKGPPFD